MSVSNLTGTKWFINSTTCTAGYGQFDIDFDIIQYAYQTGFYIGYVLIKPNLPLDPTENHILTLAGFHDLQVGDVMIITGGDDVTNVNIISWLESHATQITITDLTGTTWVMNETLGSITPNGVYYDYGIGHSFSESHSINFTNDSVDYTSFDFRGIGEGGSTLLEYYGTGVSISAASLTNEDALWNDDSYKTISITGGTDVTNQDLIAWFFKNATQQVTPSGNQYTVTHTLSNVMHGNVSFTIVPGSGYELPASSADITVTGNGSLVSYDSTTGVVVVSGDDTVAISCECPAVPSGYEVTVTFTPGAVGYDDVYDGQDSSGTLLQHGGLNGTFTYTVESGYLSIFGTSVNEYDPGTCSGGVTFMSASSSSGALHYQVSGNGSINGVWSNCFVKGTKITLADGTTKNVEDITYDDLLLVWDFYQAKLNAAKPCWIMKTQVADHYKKVTLSDGTVLKLVGQGENCHRLFNVTKQQMLYANECVGDEVYKQDGTIVTVLSCEKVYEEVEYYNLTTDTYLDCFANGVLTGSRLNNMYEIKDMKYANMERLISADEEQARWEHRWKLKKPKC